MNAVKATPTAYWRAVRYAELRDRYAKLYGDLQLVRVELNSLEAEMLELGELQEGDIA